MGIGARANRGAVGAHTARESTRRGARIGRRAFHATRGRCRGARIDSARAALGAESFGAGRCRTCARGLRAGRGARGLRANLPLHTEGSIHISTGIQIVFVGEPTESLLRARPAKPSQHASACGSLFKAFACE